MPTGKDIIQRNRECLSAVDRWVEEEHYRASLNFYGCPPRILPLLDLAWDQRPTCSDLIVYLGHRLAPVRYLEVGVSVGKNFYLAANAWERAELCGFDREAINPRLAALFELEQDEPEAPARYRFRGNRVTYLKGDVFDDASWARLAGHRFNLIYSDACHQAPALRREFAMVERHTLRDDAFCMVWDDLDRSPDGALSQAFLEFAARAKANDGKAHAFFLELNGWLGQHEHTHTVGVLNNVGITEAMIAQAFNA